VYWQQTGSADVVDVQSIHEGNGAVKRRGLFKEASRLPIRIEVWELDTGVGERSRAHEGDVLDEVYY
jgi:hypothetical protein